MSRPIRVAILGAGSWGSTVACLAARNAKTSSVVMELARCYAIQMPIAAEVAAVAQGTQTAKGAFRGLLRMAAGSEREAA